jgi:hypothetical protein
VPTLQYRIHGEIQSQQPQRKVSTWYRYQGDLATACCVNLKAIARSATVVYHVWSFGRAAADYTIGVRDGGSI